MQVLDEELVYVGLAVSTTNALLMLIVNHGQNFVGYIFPMNSKPLLFAD